LQPARPEPRIREASIDALCQRATRSKRARTLHAPAREMEPRQFRRCIAKLLRDSDASSVATLRAVETCRLGDYSDLSWKRKKRPSKAYSVAATIAHWTRTARCSGTRHRQNRSRLKFGLPCSRAPTLRMWKLAYKVEEFYPALDKFSDEQRADSARLFKPLATTKEVRRSGSKRYAANMNRIADSHSSRGLPAVPWINRAVSMTRFFAELAESFRNGESRNTGYRVCVPVPGSPRPCRALDKAMRVGPKRIRSGSECNILDPRNLFPRALNHCSLAQTADMSCRA